MIFEKSDEVGDFLDCHLYDVYKSFFKNRFAGGALKKSTNIPQKEIPELFFASLSVLSN